MKISRYYFIINFAFFCLWQFFFCSFEQAQCLLHGIIASKEAPTVIDIGLLSIETTAAAITTISTTTTEAGMTITFETITISATIRGNSGSSMIILVIIQLVMFNLAMRHLSKGGNFQPLHGETVQGTICKCPMNLRLLPFHHPIRIWFHLFQFPMLRCLLLRAVNVIAQNWRMMSQCLCRGMRLRDYPLQEKMALMHYAKHICDIHIVHSFKILDCGLNCKLCILNSWSYLLFLCFYFVLMFKISLSHVNLTNCIMYLAGHKPLLALPWFCAIVFLFGDHMLAMTDLWVAIFCTEKFQFYFLLFLGGFSLRKLGPLVCCLYYSYILFYWYGFVAVDCYCCSLSCCKVRGDTSPSEWCTKSIFWALS